MVQNLKDLEKLLKLCRKQGVTEINLGQVSFKLGDLPQDQIQENVQYDEAQLDPYANFPGGILSPEELAYYATGGLPENSPFKKETN